MNKKIHDYTQRFISSANQYRIETFFTQLSLEDFASKLPYIYTIEKFCNRLQTALIENQRICIYSDYDTDAVTATATMYWGLIWLGFKKEKLSFYAPDRFSVGYGMNILAVQEIAYNNDLIISVDCGINSVLEAEKILEMKQTNVARCDLIITDHHHLSGEIPNCEAVCNPRLSFNWTEYSFILHDKSVTTTNFLPQSVTGVGVAWFCVVWLGYYLDTISTID